MKISKVLGARAARFVNVAPTAAIYIPDAVRLIHNRYSFVRAPMTAEELLGPLDEEANRPLTFYHGKFTREGQPPIPIEGLEIYRHLIAVDSAISTDDADLVLDDLLSLSAEVLKRSQTRRIYISQLEVEFQPALDVLWRGPERLAQSIAEMLSRYLDDEAPKVPFRLSSIALQTDPKERALPCDFRIERRLKMPFETNLYFCQAPLRTPDHLFALEQVEEYLGKLAKADA